MHNIRGSGLNLRTWTPNSRARFLDQDGGDRRFPEARGKNGDRRSPFLPRASGQEGLHLRGGCGDQINLYVGPANGAPQEGLHAHPLGGWTWPRRYDETQLKHQRFSWHMEVSSHGGNPKSAKIVSPCSMTSSCSFLQGKSWFRRVPAPSSWVPLEVTFSPLLQALRCNFLGGCCDFLGNDPSVCDLTTMSTSRTPPWWEIRWFDVLLIFCFLPFLSGEIWDLSERDRMRKTEPTDKRTVYKEKGYGIFDSHLHL